MINSYHLYTALKVINKRDPKIPHLPYQEIMSSMFENHNKAIEWSTLPLRVAPCRCLGRLW